MITPKANGFAIFVPAWVQMAILLYQSQRPHSIVNGKIFCVFLVFAFFLWIRGLSPGENARRAAEFL